VPEATPADLPRLVRVENEVRWRGQAALSIVAAVALYWIVAWYLDAPFRVPETLLVTLIVALLSTTVAGMASARRIREALQETLPTPSAAMYETRADAGDRRSRVFFLVLFAVTVMLIADRLVGGGGVIAGVVVGLFVVVGIVDVLEANRWREAELSRMARLYLLLPSNALAGRYGRVEIYERPRPPRASDEGDPTLEIDSLT
jgi:hypothetical protein